MAFPARQRPRFPINEDHLDWLRTRSSPRVGVTKTPMISSVLSSTVASCATRARVLILIALALSCAACGESPTVLTVFRKEEQAQTHCPKDIVVWLDAQSGLYYLKGHGSYGRSNAGRYACRHEADAAGMHEMPN
jgi:hypothetical protein